MANCKEIAIVFGVIKLLVLFKFEIQAKLPWKVIATDTGAHDNFVCFTDQR